MHCSKVLLTSAFLLFREVTWAKPFHHSTISKRDAYPGKGTPYPNEPQYANFDLTIPDNANHVEQIHTAFDGARRLLAAGVSSATAGDDVLARFFDTTEDDDDQDIVKSVYLQLFDLSNGNFLPLTANAVFNNADFLKLCPETTGGIQKKKRDDGEDATITSGYSDNIEGVFNIHFCNQAYAYTALDDIIYDSLDNYPSEKMNSLARIMFHEFMHWDQVGPNSSDGVLIVDQKNNGAGDVPPSDGQGAYGPSRAHALVAQNPGKCTGNADNFAWHAINAWFAEKHGSKGDFQDPPPY